MDDNEPPTKKLKQESDGPNKKVTDIELLASADDVDGSSFFEMQVRTLLREVTFAKKKCHLIDSYINSLADYLKSLKTTKIKNGTLKHMSDLFTDCHDKFHFEAPSDVNVIGSYSVKTTVKPNLNVDISLNLTKKCMRNRSGCDNYNYDMCRAAYLSHLATELQNSDLVSDINISYHHGNHLRPILNVTPNNLKLKSVHIRLHTTVSEDFYNHEELSLSHNNLKHVCKSLQREAGSKKILGGSVIYNSHMMYDLLQREHHRVITAVLSEHKSLCDAVKLLKLWAQLRQLSQDCGGFTGFISTMFMIYLLKGKKVQTFQSPYQMFKVALKELVRINFHDGISLAHVMNVTVDESLHRKKFAEKFDFVFVDSTGLMNLMASVNELTIQLVKSEAQKCLDFMDNPHCNSFDCMFLKKHNFYHKFDQIIRIRHLQHIENSVKKKKLDVVTQADYSFNRLYMCLSLMLKIVKKALNDRVVLYSIQHNTKRQWSPTECAPSAFEGHIDLGLVVNPDKAFNALDRGPSADQPEAEQFRSFWGEVSNLRRFPDTTICEAVFWRAPTLTEKRGVILRILQHILDRHFSLNPEHIVAVHASIEELLYPAPCLLKIGVPDGTGEERHIDIEKEFNDLRLRLNGLKDFPLNIDDIRGVEPVFRNAEVCPPVAAQVFQGLRSKDNACFPGETELAPPYVPAMKVQLYLESSSAWPDEISALLHTKAAFYIQLGNLLQKQYTANVIVTENYVDIVQTFYVFRLVLMCPTEVKVRTTLKSPDGVTRTVKSDSSVELSFYNTVHHKICGALANVQHINSSYNGAVRLALRWVSSHMLSDHFPNIAIELIVAHLYFQHQPYPLPSSPFGGFVRFLHFLTSHDWNLHPLIVNFYNNMDNADIADIIKDFASHRAELPIMFIATEYNKTDSFYTRHHPTPMNLQRLVQLAFKSITALELLVTTDSIKSKNFMSIFNTDTSCYDVIITLNTKQLARQFESLQPTDDSVITKQYKLLDDNKALGVMPVVDYDPVQCYLNELREAFDNVALFFYDKHGGQCIGVLWKPELANQIFSESRATNHEPDLDGDDSGEVTTISANIPAIIEDFKLIGLGIVDSVVVK